MRLLRSCVLVLVISLFLVPSSPSQTTSGIIKLTTKFIRTIQESSTIVVAVKLRAQNLGSTAVSDLNISVAETENITVGTGAFSLGTLGSKGLIESPEFTLSYPNSMTQESPKSRIVWNVQYFDSDGAQRIETVVFQ
jgi:hypothetical protein